MSERRDSKMKIKNLIAQASNFFILTVLLPVVYGCTGGGGSSVSSLLGGSVAGGASGGAGGAGGGEIALASIENPEPATMLLLGSGFIVMGYLKNRLNRT